MQLFHGKVMFLGFGSVARCTLPIFLRHVQVPPERITVLDFEDVSAAIRPWIEKGVHFVPQRITPENLGAVLSEHLSAGDLLIDLAWNIECCELLDWCHKHGVLYINTSVETWDPYENWGKIKPTERTLYWRHMKIRRLTASWSEPGPTAVIEHGANPGLISHWTKQGLTDIAQRMLDDGLAAGELREQITDAKQRRQFNHLARLLGVKVIHCSERDTQVTDRPKQVDEFVNTWSIEGLYEEGTTTAEMGWGTHEQELPRYACQHDDGPRNQICLTRMGVNTWVRSWVPDYCIRGMVIRHGEAFTISDFLTVWEDGQAVYRPTVHYAYCPCDCALLSLHELRATGYELQPRLRIMSDEIIGGSDLLGALLMGHPYKSWWTGSSLSIEESRRLVPHQNATTMQVAISVVAATLWMIEHPDRGVCVPEDLPHDTILGIANPYLGENISRSSDWTPLKYCENAFEGYNHPSRDFEDPWQFKNFLITEID